MNTSIWKKLCPVLIMLICVALGILVWLSLPSNAINSVTIQAETTKENKPEVTPQTPTTSAPELLPSPESVTDYSNIALAENVTLALAAVPQNSFTDGAAYSVGYKRLDESKLRALFGFDAQQGTAFASGTSYASGKGGPTLLFNNIGIYEYKTPLFEKLTAFFSFDSELIDSTNYFDWTQELSFLSREDALRQAIELANAMGIDVSSDARIIALSESSLNSAERELEASSLYKMDGGGKKRSWSVADECYVIVMREAMNDWPVFPNFCKRTGMQTHFSCEVTVVIGHEGVIGMRASGIYSKKEQIDEGSLLTFDDALRRLYEHYAKSPSREPLCFEHAELALVAQEDGKGIVLRPMWVFLSECATWDSTSEDEDIYYLIGTTNRTFDRILWLKPVMVDALTAEVVECYPTR